MIINGGLWLVSIEMSVSYVIITPTHSYLLNYFEYILYIYPMAYYTPSIYLFD